MNINTLSKTNAEYESSKLAVALYPTAMRKGADGKVPYHARTMFRTKLEMENIADDIIATGALEDYTAEQILTVWKVVNNAVIDRVLNGSLVDGGIGTYYARVEGSFDSEQSTFDSEKNSIDIGFRSGKTVKELASQIRPIIAQCNSIRPEVISVYDVESAGEGELTPGGFLKITGKNILVTGDNEDVGLYFVNEDDESKSVKLGADKIGVNTSSEIACVVPELDAGNYRIKVVTQCSRTSPRLDSLECIYTTVFNVQ